MNRRRWWALASAVVVLVAGVVCGVVPQSAVADAASDDLDTWSTGSHRYPDSGEGFYSKWDKWHDGWCRQGEGFAVVIDFSGAPKPLRGLLTEKYVGNFGLTASDGWIVRCHIGKPSFGSWWHHYVSSVGFSIDKYVYQRPSRTVEVGEGFDAYLLNTTGVWYPATSPPADTSKNLYDFTPGVWIHADAHGELPKLPGQGTSLDGSWPGKIPYADDDPSLTLVHNNYRVEFDQVPLDSVMYVSYGGPACRGNIKAERMLDNSDPHPAKQVCLGDAAAHPEKYKRMDPKTGQRCPGWTLMPQFSDGTVNGCVPKNPRPRPSTPTGGPTRDPGSGNGPHPRRPRHVHKPTPPVRPHPGQHRAGVGGALGRDGTPHHGVFHRNAHKDVHAGDRVSSQVRKAARTPSPSVPSSASASPSVTPSASSSPSVSPSATSSPSVSAGVVVSPSPGDGRVWGSEQQGPAASDGARRRVPGWAWGAGAGVLVAAGVVAWWMTRGRRRDREDDEVGTDLFE